MVYARITKFYALMEDNQPRKYSEPDVTSCFRSAFIEFRKMAEHAASDGFVYIKSNAMSKASSIYRVKNIGKVFEISGLAFRLAPTYGRLLVIVVVVVVV